MLSAPSAILSWKQRKAFRDIGSPWRFPRIVLNHCVTRSFIDYNVKASSEQPTLFNEKWVKHVTAKEIWNVPPRKICWKRRCHEEHRNLKNSDSYYFILKALFSILSQCAKFCAFRFYKNKRLNKISYIYAKDSICCTQTLSHSHWVISVRDKRKKSDDYWNNCSISYTVKINPGINDVLLTFSCRNWVTRSLEIRNTSRQSNLITFG